jgi:hypothetical protein
MVKDAPAAVCPVPDEHHLTDAEEGDLLNRVAGVEQELACGEARSTEKTFVDQSFSFKSSWSPGSFPLSNRSL